MLKLIKTTDTRKIEVEYSHPDTGVTFETFVIQDDYNGVPTELRCQENINYIINTLIDNWKQHHSYYHRMKTTIFYIYEYENELHSFSKVIYDSYEDIDLRKGMEEEEEF